MPPDTEVVLQGIGVSHGIAIGTASLVDVERPKVPAQKISTTAVTIEQARLADAIDRACVEINSLKDKAVAFDVAVSDEIISLLDAHLAMLKGSRLTRGATARIAAEEVTAEYALDREIIHVGDQFRASGDRYIAARIDDVEAVGFRLIRILMDVPYLSLSSVPPGGIILAREISPADAALLDPKRFAGLATVHGGAAGHTAVMARSLGLPAVLGVDPQLIDLAASGSQVIIDGVGGKVILFPTDATLETYRQKQKTLLADSALLQKSATLPAVTMDGAVVKLRANLELPRDTDAIIVAGALGIGLYRTEFLFMNKNVLPDEEEQFEAYAGVVQKMLGAEVTFRTLDIGGDKLARVLGDSIGAQANPALGLRAIRLSLKSPELLKAQFRAMLRAGAFGPVRILLPMVTTASEVVAARKILKECWRELQAAGAKLPDAIPPLGTMIEIPAAALAADSLAAVSDFFALGTNDLVQYTVAIDRGNDQVAGLYNPLNPAVLRLMDFSIQAGLRAGLSVSLCGEMGANPVYTPLLLGLGIRELSVGPASLPRIKARIRSLSLQDCIDHAQEVMNQYDPERIIDIVNEFGV